MANHSGFGALMGFARKNFPKAPTGETGSILKALVRRWPLGDVEAMVKGAALLGWDGLRAVNSKEGLGRRWAMAAYWNQENRKKTVMPESVKAIFRSMGQ